MIFTTIGTAKKETGLSYLGTVNQSSKLLKNFKVNNVLTYSLYLSPAHTSGYEVCPESTPECRMGCLNTSGLAKVELNANKTTIKDARITKTRLLIEHQEYFMNWLIAEIKSAKLKAIKLNADFSIRLNCTSDIHWANTLLNGQNIFEIFPDVQFYDYSKIFNKFENKPENYDLTFSYSGHNYSNCLRVLDMNCNVAMVFNIDKKGKLPEYFDGFEVIDGDISDLRSIDKKKVIVGLRWKIIANKAHNEIIKRSDFVIQMNDKRIGIKPKITEYELV